MQFVKIALWFSAVAFASASPDRNGHWDSGPKAKTCIVKAGNSTLIDDAPAILDAFDKCGRNGKIVFLNTTYHVNSVMNTTGLRNVDIDLRGTLVWSTNTSYWLSNSLPVGYQNQSSAWIFGGDNINFQGNGYGRFDGNGAAWVSCCGGKSNYPGRPHAITITDTHNSLFEGITFWKSQMWTMAIIHSSHILMQDITVNNALSRNTDGANTLFSDHITFNRWSVTGSDDSIAIKANSTNIAVTNSNFYNGLGLAFGSIGQYKDAFETIENITATNITCDKTLHAAYIKTWTGQQVGYPPNGGGGGLGYIKNVLMSDIRVTALRGFPFSITQCTTFSGVAGDCNTSLFQLSDITLTNISGTITSNPIAAIQCSAAAPCHDIVIKNVELDLVNGTEASGYLCSALRGNGTLGENGFVCTGSTCGKSSATGSC
ncbi:putative exo-polygalacturonase [Tricladium varicosporioides]|nr:putative exo-polygalacturonase [Hymenoscyphus varicosporioides]